MISKYHEICARQQSVHFKMSQARWAEPAEPSRADFYGVMHIKKVIAITVTISRVLVDHIDSVFKLRILTMQACRYNSRESLYRTVMYLLPKFDCCSDEEYDRVSAC